MELKDYEETNDNSSVSERSEIVCCLSHTN